MNANFIIGLILILVSPFCHAQNKSKYIRPKMTAETYSFVAPALLVDSIFIESLNTVLFDKRNYYLNNIISEPRNKSWRHIHIQFYEQDSVNYCLMISLCETPARRSVGFFEQNGFLYWFGKDTPPQIILKIKSKKRFSYKEPLPGFYDPPFLFFMYNRETGIIEGKDTWCD